MLSLQDCLALCELTEDEVRAIAEHERIPEIAAAARSDPARALALKLVLREFILKHPCCESRRQPRT